MPIKSFRPITPSLRFQTKLVNDDLTTDKPHKPLLTREAAHWRTQLNRAV